MYCVMQCIRSLQCLTEEGFTVMYCHPMRGIKDMFLYAFASAEDITEAVQLIFCSVLVQS